MFAPPDIERKGRVEITREMAEEILSMFDRAQHTEVLVVELRGNVLSVLNPLTNEYEVLGVGRLPRSMAHLT